MSVFLVVDDKHVPQYRVLWNADVPHFFGAEAYTSKDMTKFDWRMMSPCGPTQKNVTPCSIPSTSGKIDTSSQMPERLRAQHVAF